MLMETNKKMAQSSNRVTRYILRNIWKYILKFLNAVINDRQKKNAKFLKYRKNYC